ncbi:hypothetical protein FRC09_017340 [Ceratobasidium sp. 395]|nr:hypothetical protein FRC09_017340 [Ceratobasidium sp. 395]
MSNRGLSYSPPPVTTSKKRKAPAAASDIKAKRTKKAQQPQPSTSKPRIIDPFAGAKKIIRKATNAPNSFAVPRDEDGVRSWVLSVVEYAKSLEGSVAVAGSSGQLGSPPKTAQQITAEAERIAQAVNAGICRQMPWKSTCTDGRAKYEYDGVCPDPRVFGAMLGLDGPPKFATKKFTVDEFEDLFGYVRSKVQYDTLGLKSDISLKWDETTGEFNLRGKYGKGFSYGRAGEKPRRQ